MSESSKSARLEQVLAEYLDALDAARPINREELIGRHPDLADALRSFFRNRDQIEMLAEPIHAAGSAGSEHATLGLETTPEDARRVRYFGDYELLEEIARGGMGVVYKARQASLNRLVAVKMILAGQLASEADVQRFRREAEAAANLDHPNIVPIYEVGTHEGQHYFSMRFIAGASLRAELAALRADLPRAARLLATVARAVHHAHQRGVLHRDLKPGNILLDADGQPHVTDFGLAKQVAAEESVGNQPADAGRSPEPITRSGDIVGTPGYMSPEQALGTRQLTTAVDVYSLGAILYELLTGQPPFRGNTPMETLLAVIDREPESPSRIDARVDRDLETIALKCLDKDPARRYDSAAALADDLDRWLRGEPIEARPADTLERSWRWCRRNPVVASLLAACVVTLVAGTVISTIFAIEARRQAGLADAARRKSETNEQKALANLYRSGVIQAQQHLNLGETAGMIEALKAQIPATKNDPDFRRFEWYLLNRLAHAYEKSMAGHKFDAHHILYSPNGMYLATAGYQELFVWDPVAGKLLFSFTAPGQLGKEFGVNSVVFSPDSRLLAFVDGGEGSMMVSHREQPLGIRLISLPDGKPAGSFPGSMFVAFDPRGGRVATLRWDPPPKDPPPDPPATPDPFWRYAQVRSLPDGKLLKEIPIHNQAVQHLAFTADGLRLAANGVPDPSSTRFAEEEVSPGKDGIWARIWEIESGRPVRAFQVDSPVAGEEIVIVPAAQRRILRGGKLVPYDGRPTDEFPKTTAGSWAIDISPDGKLLATGSWDRGIHLFDLPSGKPRRVLLGQTGAFAHVAFSPNGRQLASVSADHRDDHTVKLWNPHVDPEGPTWTVPPQASSSMQFAFHPGGDFAIAFEPMQGKTAFWKAWALRPGRLPPPDRAPLLGDGIILFPVISEDGQFLSAQRHDRDDLGKLEIRSWSLKTGELWRRLQFDSGSFGTTRVYTRDFRHAAVSRFVDEMKPLPTNQIVIWDLGRPGDASKRVARDIAVEKAKELRSWNVEVSLWVHPLSFSGDGRLLACTARNDASELVELLVYDAESGRLVHRLDPQGLRSPVAQFSADGKRLVAATSVGFRAWDLETGQLLRSLTIPGTFEGELRRDGPPALAALSPDATRLATTNSVHGYASSRLLLWDIETGQQLLNLPAPDGYMTFEFSPSGEQLIFQGYDESDSYSSYVRIWDGSPKSPR